MKEVALHTCEKPSSLLMFHLGWYMMHVMMSVSTSVVIPIWYLAVLIIFEPVWSKHATCYFVNSDLDGFNIVDKACRKAELPDEYASSERKCQKRRVKKRSVSIGN